MKKLVILLLPLVLILFSSCEKKEADKDVETSIKKLTLFNNTFAKLNADGVISKESAGEESSEFDKLKKIANEYYKSINKINDNIAEEKKEMGEANSIEGKYEKAYKKALTDNQAKIDEATKLFEANLSQMKQ